MNNLVTALAPVFAAGFAVQQLLEILTSLLDLDAKETFQKYKKAILGLLSLIVGFVLAYKGYLQVLHPLLAGDVVTDPATHKVTIYYTRDIPDYLDLIVTGLVISAGTEGVNSILKFIKYSKEEKKNEAASTDPTNAPAAPATPTVHAPTSAALAKMNQK
jgi:hypothetical protein